MNDATAEAQGASAAHIVVRQQALAAKESLNDAVKDEEVALTASLKEQQDQAADQWDSHFDTLKAKMNDIDTKYQSFQACISDGQWICDM